METISFKLLKHERRRRSTLRRKQDKLGYRIMKLYREGKIDQASKLLKQRFDLDRSYEKSVRRSLYIKDKKRVELMIGTDPSGSDVRTARSIASRYGEDL